MHAPCSLLIVSPLAKGNLTVPAERFGLRSGMRHLTPSRAMRRLERKTVAMSQNGTAVLNIRFTVLADLLCTVF